MIVANFVTNRSTMGDTRTYEDFYKFLGTKPVRLGLVARLYPELTALYLTDSLMNVFYMDNKPGNQFRSIDAMYFEWEVETNYIKRIAFAAVPIGNGANGSEITMAFTERYYEKYDIFKIDKTHQQCQVVSRPLRKADNYWEVQVRLLDNDYSSELDFDGCQIGDTTRFQSNAMPELSEEGYCKYQSSIEKHQNYITTFRCDESYSSLYAAHEDVFISIGKGEGNGKMKETIYKMDRAESNLLKNFMFARNQGLLFNKTNIDKNGKPTIQDPDTNRPIYIGDGLVPQIERFASKYGYNKLTVEVIQTALNMLSQKSETPTGNKYMFVVNQALWNQVQLALSEWLARFHTCGTYLWSKEANGYVKVGATFSTYEIGGNEVTFKVDRALTHEYGDKGYGILIDLTADKVSGQPAVAQFTFKGGEFISSKYPGVGGMSGLESGIVSSTVAGSKIIAMGYAGIGVFAPYRSFIIYEN